MLLLIAIYRYNTETFDDIRKIKTIPELKDDKLFDDITTYDNDKDDNGLTGLDKCIKSCNGMCVEFGVTGVATCYNKMQMDTEFEKIEAGNDYVRGLNYTALR
jgi:hypothetical protein